jgi:formylglycine-generating enzyme required for sulfatase activity
MMGNVWEWNETLIDGSSRGTRGGSYGNYDYHLISSTRGSSPPDYGVHDSIGFRVASVPEPCSLALLGLGGLILRKRK